MKYRTEGERLGQLTRAFEALLVWEHFVHLKHPALSVSQCDLEPCLEVNKYFLNSRNGSW